MALRPCRGRAARRHCGSQRPSGLERRERPRSSRASSSPCSARTEPASRRCCDLLLGLLAPHPGTVSVLGRLARRPRSGEIGYLPQRHGFDATTRIRGVDIVRLGLDGNRFGLAPAVADRPASSGYAEVIELVGATDYAERPIGECSGGEQQRLLIARSA